MNLNICLLFKKILMNNFDFLIPAFVKKKYHDLLQNEIYLYKGFVNGYLVTLKRIDYSREQIIIRQIKQAPPFTLQSPVSILKIIHNLNILYHC